MTTQASAWRDALLGGLVGLFRGLAILTGLFFSAAAGSLYLGAYMQRFQVLHSIRTRGSDGYPLTWEGALLLAGIATCIALLLTFALPPGRLSALYLWICCAVACVAAALESVPRFPWSNWLGLVTVGGGAIVICVGGWNARFGRWIGPVAAGAALAVMLVMVGVATARDTSPGPLFRPTVFSLPRGGANFVERVCAEYTNHGVGDMDGRSW